MLLLSLLWVVLGLLIGALANAAKLRPAAWVRGAPVSCAPEAVLLSETQEQSWRTSAENITVFSQLETNSLQAHLPLDNGSPVSYSLSRDKPFVGLRKRDMMTRSVKAHEYASK